MAYEVPITFGFYAAVIWIFLYAFIRCKRGNGDALQWSLFKDPVLSEYTDLWALLHFILFFSMACLYPGRGWLLFGIGVLWELVEMYIGNQGDWNQMVFGGCSDTADGNWWYGRYQDVIVNGLGILAGTYLSRR